MPSASYLKHLMPGCIKYSELSSRENFNQIQGFKIIKIELH
jgi:hypothetical protein